MNPLKKELTYFLVLCETLNITNAAEAVGIQQAGLSKSLKSLEEELSQPLFYRSHRGLKPTPFGRILEKNLRESLKEWDTTFGKDLKSLEEVIGNYRIGAHSTIALNSFSRFFPTLLEAHPRLNLKAHLLRSPEVTKKVAEFQIEFGLVANPYPHPDLVVVPLYQEFIGVWGAGKKPKEKILYYNSEMIQIVHTLKKYQGYKKVEVESYDVLASIVQNSNGLGILPNPVAERFSSLVPIGGKLKNVQICLIYRHDLAKTPSFFAIVNAIKKNLKAKSTRS